MGWAVSNFLVADKAPQPLGNNNVTASPSGTFKTGEGLLNIAANKQEQFEALCQLIGRDDLIADPRFAERQARLENRELLTGHIEAAFAVKSAKQWESALNHIGVPAGRVLSVPQALDLPQVQGRDFTGCFVDSPGINQDVRYVRTGFKLDGKRPAVTLPPPQLGRAYRTVVDDIGVEQRKRSSSYKDRGQYEYRKTGSKNWP